MRHMTSEVFTLVEVRSITQSIGRKSRREEGNEGGGSKILSETRKVASRGLRSKVEAESEEVKFR